MITLCILTHHYLIYGRVHDKPYVELKDSDGRPDEIVSQEVCTVQLLYHEGIGEFCKYLAWASCAFGL